MVQLTHLKPCDEARIEEEEFYSIALDSKWDEKTIELEKSIEDFFCDEKIKLEKKELYPLVWRDRFYDPYKKRL